MKQNRSWALAALVMKITPLFFFSSSLNSFIYVYDLLKLFLYNLIMMCVAARAYLLGYNCADEKELEAALRFC